MIKRGFFCFIIVILLVSFAIAQDVFFIGDFNEDCSIDLADFGLFYASFRSCLEDNVCDEKFDLNSDKFVGVEDFIIFGDHFGDHCRNYDSVKLIDFSLIGKQNRQGGSTYGVTAEFDDNIKRVEVQLYLLETGEIFSNWEKLNDKGDEGDSTAGDKIYTKNNLKLPNEIGNYGFKLRYETFSGVVNELKPQKIISSSAIGPTPDCKPLYEGHNDPLDGDRINLVVVRTNKLSTEEMLDFAYASLGLRLNKYTDDWYGLFQLEPFISNKNKFNLWYIERESTIDLTSDEWDNIEARSRLARDARNQISTWESICGGQGKGLSDSKFTFLIFHGGSFRSLGNKDLAFVSTEGGLKEDCVEVSRACHNPGMDSSKCDYDFLSSRNYCIFSSQIAVHEFGHSFGLLADEYNYDFLEDLAFYSWWYHNINYPDGFPTEPGNDFLYPYDPEFGKSQCYYLGAENIECKFVDVPQKGFKNEGCFPKGNYKNVCEGNTPWRDLIGNGCGKDGVVDCDDEKNLNLIVEKIESLIFRFTSGRRLTLSVAADYESFNKQSIKFIDSLNAQFKGEMEIIDGGKFKLPVSSRISYDGEERILEVSEEIELLEGMIVEIPEEEIVNFPAGLNVAFAENSIITALESYREGEVIFHSGEIIDHINELRLLKDGNNVTFLEDTIILLSEEAEVELLNDGEVILLPNSQVAFSKKGNIFLPEGLKRKGRDNIRSGAKFEVKDGSSMDFVEKTRVVLPEGSIFKIPYEGKISFSQGIRVAIRNTDKIKLALQSKKLEITCENLGCTFLPEINRPNANSIMRNSYLKDPAEFKFGVVNERLICNKLSDLVGEVSFACKGLCLNGCEEGKRCVEGECR